MYSIELGFSLGSLVGIERITQPMCANKKGGETKEQDAVGDSAQDQRAWRVAQLAAQLAGSDVLRHSMKPDMVDHLPEDKQKDSVLPPNSRRLDGWFNELFDRADWLLTKSEDKHTGPWMFADFFEPQKRYSQKDMADIISGHGIDGWSQQSTSEKLKTMGSMMTEKNAKSIANDVYWLSMEDKGAGIPVNPDEPSVVNTSCVNTISDVLTRDYDTDGDLFCAVMKQARFLCGKLQNDLEEGWSGEDGVLYYHTFMGGSGEIIELSPMSIAEVYDMTEDTGLPVDQIILPYVKAHFRYRQAIKNLSSNKNASQGGSRSSAGIQARDLFRLAREADLPEEYWSAPRV